MTIKPSDESLKQGRNRSWQAVLTLNTLAYSLYYDSSKRLLLQTVDIVFLMILFLLNT